MYTEMGEMAAGEFVMISKCFSDGIFLEKKHGPEWKREVSSEQSPEDRRSYVTSANLVPTWRAKHFVTTLTVGEDLEYCESVLFGRETVLKSYSESVSAFPGDKVQRYRSELVYEPNATGKHFVAGIELLPARRCVGVEIDHVLCRGDVTERFEKHVNGDVSACSLISGEARTVN